MRIISLQTFLGKAPNVVTGFGILTLVLNRFDMDIRCRS